MKESILQGDWLLELNHFWSTIDTALTSTLECNKGIRDYTSLDSTTSIKSKLVPPFGHADFNFCNPTYFRSSSIFRDHLLKLNVISSVLAPKSYKTLTRYKIDDDGFNILQKLVFTGSPQLGGEECDLYKFVNTLTFIPDEYLVNLYVSSCKKLKKK